LEGIFPNCVLRIISINRYRMPCSIRENITQFSTNTRCKTFSLFIYSTGIEKKNGSLQQQQNKHIKTTTTTNKQRRKNKTKQKNEKYRLKKNINSNCGQLSLSLFHIWCIWLSRCSLYAVHLSCNLVFESMKKYNFVKY